jgi:hypothetical protein
MAIVAILVIFVVGTVETGIFMIIIDRRKELLIIFDIAVNKYSGDNSTLIEFERYNLQCIKA